MEEQLIAGLVEYDHGDLTEPEPRATTQEQQQPVVEPEVVPTTTPDQQGFPEIPRSNETHLDLLLFRASGVTWSLGSR